MAKVSFQRRFRHPARASTVGEMQATLDGGQRTGRIAGPMLP